jgi:hypothetical protein
LLGPVLFNRGVVRIVSRGAPFLKYKEPGYADHEHDRNGRPDQQDQP